MRRIHQLLRILKEKFKQKLQIPDKPLLDLIASYLLNILIWLLLVYAVAVFFEATILFGTDSLAEVIKIITYSSFFYASILLFSFVFCYISAQKIVPKIREFDSLTKYKFLQIRGSIMTVFVFLLAIMVAFAPFVFLQPQISGILRSQTIIQQINGLFVAIVVGLFGIAFPFIFFQVSEEVETNLNFTLFEDFEALGKYHNQQIIGVSKSRILVLKPLMKQIVYRAEKL